MAFLENRFGFITAGTSCMETVERFSKFFNCFIKAASGLVSIVFKFLQSHKIFIGAFASVMAFRNIMF